MSGSARRRTVDQPLGDRLVHPDDLEAWRVWQADRRRVRNFLRPNRNQGPPVGVLTIGGPDARALVVLDGVTPSNKAALEEPIRFFDAHDVAVLAPTGPGDVFKAGSTRQVSSVQVSSADDLARALPGLEVVVSAGDFLPLSGLAHELIDRIGGRSFVVQHGALTPFTPPLPATTLLAWSEADGTFWRSGRDEIDVEVTGSQLLWTAAGSPSPAVDPNTVPTFLGQLHGAELPRSLVFRICRDFCRATGATYRPHPSEKDKISRVAHRVMRRGGIEFAPSDTPLGALGTPVVGLFSSGILEAAAAGLPAWGYYPNPPTWLSGFWGRYGIASWGEDPTPPPARPEIEPAERIAQIVRASIGAT